MDTFVFYTTIFVYPPSPQTQSDKYKCFFGKLINLVKLFTIGVVILATGSGRDS